MADSILRLKVESQEYDNKLKRAAEGLNRYVENCRKVGGTLEVVEKDTLEFVRAMGQMETTAKTATGKLSEMKRTFQEWGMVYKQMTDAEKQSPVGKALSQSLDQLKGRIQETKRDMQSLEQELNGSKFGQFGSILDGIGQKMGLNANITELLTSKTALMSAGIGAAGAIVGKAAQEWAKYNAELAKQDQITTVTTGLKGPESDRMTDQARALTDTYGVDFREAINAANTLMTQFGQTGEQAMSLIRDGMQGMIQGDGPKLLSMIQQYAPAFQDAGVTASQLVAVIQNSEGGIFTDQNMNAIVMGIKNIRLMTKATSDALAQLGIDGQKMSQQLRDGSMTIFDALKQVATQIQGVNSGSQAAGEVMQQVFGRQGAMAGTKLGEAIATLNTNLEETKRQTGEVGDAYNDLYNANVRLNRAIRECFGYDGWNQMAAGIKTNLITALSDVVDGIGRVKDVLTSDVGTTIFDTISSAAFSAMRPLGQLYKTIKDVINLQGNIVNSGNGGGNTKTGMNAILEHIMSYNSKDARERAYQFYLRRINQSLAKNQTTVVTDDGNGHYTESIRPNRDANNKKLLNDKLLLINSHDRLINAPIRKNNSTNTPPTITVNTIPTTTTGSGGGGGRSGGGRNGRGNTTPTKTQLTGTQKNQQTISQLTTEYQALSDKVKQASDSEVASINNRMEAIRSEIKLLQERNAEIQYQADVAQGKYPATTTAPEPIVKPRTMNPADTVAGVIKQNLSANGDMSNVKALPELTAMEQALATLKEQQEVYGSSSSEVWQSYQQQIEDVENRIEQFKGKSVSSAQATTKSWNTAASAISTVSSAIAMIKDPAAKIMATIGQAIANVALAYGETLAKDKHSKSNIYAFIAAAASAMVSMVSTISTIKSSAKYAEGGIIKGNSYSGDNIQANNGAINLNAGELILNRAQQGVIASSLGDNRAVPVMRPYVDGEVIFLGMNNTSKRHGRGEIVTTSMLRKYGLIP